MKKFQKYALMALAVVLAVTMLAGTAAPNKLTQDEVNTILNTTTDETKVTSPIIEVANKAKQSVLGVNNYQISRSDYFGFGYGYFRIPGAQEGVERLYGTGSGVVVTEYGHIITNKHVVDDADRITVAVEGKEYPAELVASDAALDLAVLYCPTIKLPAAPLGDSDKLQVGEYAIVIGNPLGEEFERTVTVGYVSAINREVKDKVSDRYGRQATIVNQMIQVDAAINSGNSGGGMFNTLGQLQGIPARKYDNAGTSIFTQRASIDNIGMCIPVNVAKPLLEQVLLNFDASQSALAKEEETDTDTPRPRLGVTVKTLSPLQMQKTEGSLPYGAYVIVVEENSPASEAGIKVGDIVVEVDGEVVTDSSKLVELITSRKAGETFTIKVFRTEAGENTESVNDVGESDYIDLEVTLRILDDVKM
ncbi:MAG: S1C family serine protease [Christensenellales bacterium]|jgi:serine protease Do|nr:PDZ domain-containing protein [Clostridiales bacterium]